MRHRHYRPPLALLLMLTLLLSTAALYRPAQAAERLDLRAKVEATGKDAPTGPITVELVREKDDTVLAKTELNQDNNYEASLAKGLGLDILDLPKPESDLRGHLRLRISDTTIDKNWRIRTKFEKGVLIFRLVRDIDIDTPRRDRDRDRDRDSDEWTSSRVTPPAPADVVTGELYITKIVTGATGTGAFNMALSLANATTPLANRSLTVSTYSADGKLLGTRNVLLNNNLRVDLRLHHGESALVQGIPEYTAYTLREGVARDYRTHYLLNGEETAATELSRTIVPKTRSFIEVRNEYKGSATTPNNNTTNSSSKKSDSKTPSSKPIPKTGAPLVLPLALGTAALLLRKH